MTDEERGGRLEVGRAGSFDARAQYIAGGMYVIGEVLRARGKEPLEQTIGRIMEEFGAALREGQ